MTDQDAFATALLNPELPCPDNLRTRSGGNAAGRFAVYRNNVIVSLIDALADSYPVCLALVGEPFFRAMARIYALANPPRERLMAFYGHDFPDFMDRFPPAGSVPYLGDVARLEMARIESYHAADADPVSLGVLQQALANPDALPGARFLLHPSLRLRASGFAIVSLWSAHQGLLDLETVETARSENAMIIRVGLHVHVHQVSDADQAFLTRLAAGSTLAAAVEAGQAVSPGFDPSPALTAVIREQAIIGITLPEEITS